MAKQVKRRPKGARKKFFEVSMPLISTKVHLYGYSPEDLEGNIVKIDLTRSLRGKNMELKARVNLKGGKLEGEPLSLQIMPSYIKKIMRRGTDYVEDSFEVQCKDATILIKPFMITRRRVSRVIIKTIRETARKHLTSKITIRNTEELISEIMTNKLQKELSLKIKKIYPLSLCEIRVFKVINREGNKKADEKKEKIEKEEGK